MTKRIIKYKYELVDSLSGETLVVGTSGIELLRGAASYIRNQGIAYDEVTYVIISSGAKAQRVFSATGEALAELIHDELDIEVESIGDEWDD